jgi:hypothetical protein
VHGGSMALASPSLSSSAKAFGAEAFTTVAMMIKPSLQKKIGADRQFNYKTDRLDD